MICNLSAREILCNVCSQPYNIMLICFGTIQNPSLPEDVLLKKSHLRACDFVRIRKFHRLIVFIEDQQLKGLGFILTSFGFEFLNQIYLKSLNQLYRFDIAYLQLVQLKLLTRQLNINICSQGIEMDRISFGKKVFYIGFISTLTCTTISATYWQFNRYHQSKKRWAVIRKQLNKDQPQDLLSLVQSSNSLSNSHQNEQIYPYRYVKFKASQIFDSQQPFRVRRPKRQRIGQLLFRPLLLSNDKLIVVQQGWIPQGYQQQKMKQRKISKKSEQNEYIGLIRANEKPGSYDQKQKDVYLHINALDIYNYFKQNRQSIQKGDKQLLFNNYYIQLLKPLNTKESQQEQQTYPYKHRVDNFELPYLTPDKHLAYMSFWGLTTCVGLFGIFKVLLM